MAEATNEPSRSTAGDATRQRLIEAAERLVAERGVDSVSVRDITSAADANSASIHYHFRSKEGLLRAVLEHRAEMMRERRDVYLEQLRAGDPTLEDIVTSMVGPTFDLAVNGHEDEAASYVAFIASMLEHASMVPVIREYFDGQFSAYVELAKEVCPDLSHDSLINRLSFGFFLVFNAASEPPRGLRSWVAEYDPDSLVHIKDDLIQFIIGGLERR